MIHTRYTHTIYTHDTHMIHTRYTHDTHTIYTHDTHMRTLVALPFEAVEKSAMVTLVVTAYGGHIGFLEGVLPTRQMLTDRVCKEFLLAMKEYHSKVA